MQTEYLDRKARGILYAALDGISISTRHEYVSAPKPSALKQAIEDLKQERRMSFAGRFCDWMPKAMIQRS